MLDKRDHFSYRASTLPILLIVCSDTLQLSLYPVHPGPIHGYRGHHHREYRIFLPWIQQGRMPPVLLAGPDFQVFVPSRVLL